MLLNDYLNCSCCHCTCSGSVIVAVLAFLLALSSHVSWDNRPFSWCAWLVLVLDAHALLTSNYYYHDINIFSGCGKQEWSSRQWLWKSGMKFKTLQAKTSIKWQKKTFGFCTTKLCYSYRSTEHHFIIHILPTRHKNKHQILGVTNMNTKVNYNI
jgi:hypothetical protein